MSLSDKFVERFERPILWASLIAFPGSVLGYVYTLRVLFDHAHVAVFSAIVVSNLIALIAAGILADPPKGRSYRPQQRRPDGPEPR